ncbi:MAG: hypothetical protein D6690_13740 [Nitrospirae bacterium]|nr:MAG: hypothetical protein D6690_13740 [Nitrospirota bacterium]
MEMELRSPRTPQSWFQPIVRYVVAPVAFGFSGFHTTDFLLSGIYTWPRTSRIVVLTLAMMILSYEFVYKDVHSPCSRQASPRSVKTLLYVCLLPYMLGSLILLVLFSLAQG